ARILQPAVLAVDVALVDGPADALGGAALVLALDIARMDGLAGVLDHAVALDQSAAGLLVDLGVAEMDGEADARTLGVDLGMAGDRAAGGGRLLGDVGERQRLEVASVGAGRFGVALLPHHGLRRDAPDLGGAAAQLADAIAGRLDGGHARGESGA